MFVRLLAALDITGMRIPTLRPIIIPKHKIVTFSMPKRAKVRPLNPQLSARAKEKLLTWQKQRAIRESLGSPQAHGLVVVGKKDGDIRCCVYFRQLKELTAKDAYPRHNIQAGMYSLCKLKYFTALECRSAYLAVPLDEESIPKTAVVTQLLTLQF